MSCRSNGAASARPTADHRVRTVPRAQKVVVRDGPDRASSHAPLKAPLQAPLGEVVDTLLLKFDDRCKQQGFVFGGKGTCIEFDFPAPPRLHTDDLLVLDDGKLAEVVADIEPVIEVRARDFAAVARLVLALGNRHVPVQVLANRIRLQKRPVIEALLAEHGLAGIEMTAPFEPDDGPRDHGHGHDHHHGRAHTHHHHDGHGDHDQSPKSTSS
jgi:urease accessory protein